MFNKISIIAVIATAGFLQDTKGQEDVQNITSRTQTFQSGSVNASSYSIQYTVFENETTLTDTFNATLIIKDYNISHWTANNSGMWLGLGYGSEQIENSDVTICSYNFTNFTQNFFACQDGKYENGAFNFNENQNVTDVQTIIADFNFETNTANFSVGFMRPFITNENETGQDTNLTATQMNIIWAYGNVENGTVINPVPENSGAVILDLTLMPLPQPQPTEEQPSSEGTPTTPPTEEERNRGDMAREKERLAAPSSSASSLSAIFSVLVMVGALLHLA